MGQAKLTLRPPQMEVKLKPGYWPDLARMQQTVREAGYKPIEDGVELVLTEGGEAGGDGLAVELDGMKAPATLPVVAAKEEQETAAHLERHLGEAVELEGRWQPGKTSEGPGSLAVQAITGPDERHDS